MKIFPLLFLFSIEIFSQGVSVSGRVVDSTYQSPLSNANVILIHLPDSSSSGTATDRDGFFMFRRVKPGSYLIKISYVGYKKYVDFLEIGRNSVEFETVSLAPGESSIGDVEIVDKLPPVIQNADTTEYNADAFQTSKDANTEDLITKMPGITVTGGTVKAKGEEVKKVTVDGRNFFGDDPTATLRNLPAEVVEKIQVFDEQSEQTKFTGFDDGNTTKTMNIVTRTRVRQGTFGRLNAGYGTEDRYNGSGNLNFFNNDERISLIAQLNNINEQNFSREDLLGVTSSGGRRGGGGMMGRGGPSGRSGGGSDFLVATMNGLSTTKALGLNYSNKYWDSFNMSAGYFFNVTDNDAESSVKREYFIPGTEQIYNEINTSVSKNINHRLNVRIDYQIDTLNDLTFRPRISFQQNEGISSALGTTESGLKPINLIGNNYNSDLSAVNSNAEFLFRHRFETRGRTFSVGVNSFYNNNQGDSKLLSENIYYLNTLASDTIDQVSDNYRDGRGISSNMTYTEPLTENGIIQFTTGFSFSKDQSDQKKFGMNDGGYSLLDTSLSNVAEKNYSTQFFGTGYRYQLKEISFNANINYNISSLKNNQQFPYTTYGETRFTSFLPSAMMRWNISQDQDLHFFYRTSNNDPSIQQLQDVLDNSNPMQLSIGNPYLGQDFRHSFSMRYSQMDTKTLNSFFAMMNFSFVNDYIGNNTVIAGNDTMSYRGVKLSPGTQLTTPVNLDGYLSLSSTFVYSLPVEFIKSYLNLNADLSLNRIPSMINGGTGYSNSNTVALGVVLTSNISPELDFTLSSTSSYNRVKDEMRSAYSDEYFNEYAGFRFRFQFWDRFVILHNLNYSYDSGLDEYNRNLFLWNLSFGIKVFSNNQGEIRISAYDILNKNTNVQRTSTDSYIQDTRSNTIGKYFLLSFVYQLRSFGSENRN